MSMIADPATIADGPRAALARELLARVPLARSKQRLARRLDIALEQLNWLLAQRPFGRIVGRKIATAFPELRELVAECLLADDPEATP